MRRIPLALLALALGACARAPQDPAAVMTTASFEQHVRVLSQDAFGGRAPASLGEQRTVRYLTDRFEALGLRPGNGRSWTQEVPLVGITAAPGARLEVRGGKSALSYENGKQAVLFTKRTAAHVALERSELVFVGYGVTAPEVGWDDFKGLDVRGKTLLVLVNDPDYATATPGAFGGKRMTYYGRWTYKFEEAARRGAAGVLLVHDTGPAGYGWDVVTGSWNREQFDIASDGADAQRSAIEGWLTHEAAAEVLAAAGQDLAALEIAAQSRDFKPVALGLTASATLDDTIRTQVSHNVLALIPGAEHPDEVIVFTAHWDHLGTDPKLPGDQIFNGAVDNATGVAGLLELADAFRALRPRPTRSLLFIAVTAEESGLLGSRWYVEHPVFPLAKTVAEINMDSLNVDGPKHDVAVTGRGASELEDLLAVAARAQGRYLVDEPAPQEGHYYRSDHFNFAKHGVPALDAQGGVDLVAGGIAAGKAAADRYRTQDYHRPSDEMRPGWDTRGALEDLRLFFAIGRELASGDAWPNWRAGNEFRAARDTDRPAGR